ncbi:MAG: NAD(P)/FAD-dependent oxidoreductase [Thiohalospira sp.]
MEGRDIAVVGGGISGLGAAWLLQRRHSVTLYERNAVAGGHTHTVDAPAASGPVPVDTGFIVYNERNYPHLTGLFATLGIETRPSEMSFSASVDGGQLEYAGSSLATLFAQRRNLFRPRFWGMLRDILRFNRQGRALLAVADGRGRSLGEFLTENGYGTAFRDHYLLPMAAAIWSCPVRTMLDFPLVSFLRFFDNHGLLQLDDRPRWRTVVGGGRVYVDRILADLQRRQGTGAIRAGDPVVRVERDADGVTLTTADGYRNRHDQVVLAGHADEMHHLLGDASASESALLGRFRYQPNHAVLHSDPALMPRRRAIWSAWNYLADGSDAGTERVSVTYWMNCLQGLEGADGDLFVSLNPLQEPDPERVIARRDWDHPVFDQPAMEAQSGIAGLQGVNRTWYAGAWLGYGFHEDGLRSAVAVARGLGVEPPWTAAAPAGAETPLPAGEPEVP